MITEEEERNASSLRVSPAVVVVSTINKPSAGIQEPKIKQAHDHLTIYMSQAHQPC